MSNDENPNQSIDKKSENDKPDSTHSQVEKKVEAKQQPPPSKSTAQSFHERMLAPKIKSDSKNMDDFLGPMLAELEKVMADNMKQLDKLEEELLGDDKNKRAGPDPAGHIPIAIRGRKSIDSIMKNLGQIIALNNDDPDIKIDPSQKRNHEFLQTKLNKTSEYVREKLLQKEEKEKKRMPQETSLETEVDQQAEKEPISEFTTVKSKNINHITSMAHSLSAHLISSTSQKKDGAKLKNITVKIYDSVNLWLSRLFSDLLPRFDDSSVLFHEQEPEGLIRMCNVVMNYKFSQFKENGFQAFNLKQPAIYISAASKYALPEYKEIISIQLNLPISSIRIVEVSKSNDLSLNKIDIGLLTQQLDADISNGYVPLLLVASAGSDNIGQCDDLNKLNHLTRTYRIWLHLEGVYLSSLIMYSVPTEIQPVMSGDSLTVDFGNLIGISSLCHITLYKNRTNTNTYLQPYNNIKSTLYKSLPYWCVLQSIGHEGVIEKVQNASNMAYYIDDIVKKHQKYIQILSFKPRDETTTKRYTLSELLVSALSMLTFVDYTNPVVLFKCDRNFIKERITFFSAGNVDVEEVKVEKKVLSAKEQLFNQFRDTVSEREQFMNLVHRPEPSLEFFNKKKSEPQPQPKSEEEIKFDADITEYTDNLTTWLCTLLNSLHKKIELEAFELENNGVCIRYSPMEHANVCGTAEYDLHMFSKSLDDIIVIIDASIKCKATFNKEIKKFSNLIPVNIPKWAGIGAVRYIPEYLLNKIDDILKYAEYKNASTNTKRERKTEMVQEIKETVLENDATNEHDQKNAEEGPETDVVNENMKSEQSEQFVKEPYDVGTRWDFDKYINDINDINEKLVKKLQAEDGAFSLGVATDSLKGIKFGMVNESDAVEKLAAQVQEIGKEIEENSKYLEKMTDVIREAILKANKDLKKENEAKLTQQGVIRQIPLVGGLFNWIAPIEPQKAVGRSLNLESGVFESTEVIYNKRKTIVDERQKRSLNEQGYESDLESQSLENSSINSHTNKAFESNENHMQDTKNEQVLLDSSETTPK